MYVNEYFDVRCHCGSALHFKGINIKYMKSTLLCCKNKLSQYKHIKFYTYEVFCHIFLEYCDFNLLTYISLTISIIYRYMKESLKLTLSFINIKNAKYSLPLTKFWRFNGCNKHTQLKIYSVVQEHGYKWNEYGTFYSSIISVILGTISVK